MKYHKEYIEQLVKKGGPIADDYYDLNAWIIEITDLMRTGDISREELNELTALFGDALSPETMQGFVLQKPHGYAGDFEIIDRIYQNYVSSKSHLSKWDIYLHSHSAPQAVRNRITYLTDLIEQLLPQDRESPFEILNLASGPGRDMHHFFTTHPNAPVHFDCIEQDQQAIDHASELCRDYSGRISFHKRNALRFRSDKRYDLIWSAGLFDYFDNKLFGKLLQRLSPMVKEGGEIVIGNFSTCNPSKPYMELMEWHLHHRSPQTLKAIAREAGFSPERITVKKEETGVNLFLHLSK